MPHFVAEAPADELAPSDSDIAEDPLTPSKLLSLPHAALSDRFIQTALDLKETVSSASQFVWESLLKFWFCGFLGFFDFCFGLRFVVLGREGDVDVE